MNKTKLKTKLRLGIFLFFLSLVGCDRAIEFFFPDSSIYSAGYSKQIFSTIQTGMTKDKVKKVLGEPLVVIEQTNGRIKRKVLDPGGKNLEIFPDLPQGDNHLVDSFTWFFSQPGASSQNWHIKAITFNDQDEVIKITDEFYVD